MIFYTEFETNKWTKTESNEWTRLGVTVVVDGGYYKVKFRYDSPSYCFYSLYTPIHDTTMSGLVETIKYGINYILTHKSHSKILTPKYKRTLKNWLYVN